MAYKQKGFPKHSTKSVLKQMDVVGAREPVKGTIDKDGYEVTKGDEYSPDVKTKAVIDKSGKGPVITGNTKVVETYSNRRTDPKTGKVYSKVRGPSAERVTSTSIVGHKGTQKGKTKVVKDNPVSKSDFLAESFDRDDSNPFGGNRKYNPKTRSFR